MTKQRAGKRVRKQQRLPKLYRAVAEWVARYGGQAIVLGGIELQQWPGEREGNFWVAVRVFGRKPDTPLKARRNTP